MFKKLNSLFLSLCLFSLQADERPKFLDFNNLIQKSYDQIIIDLSKKPNKTKFLPKKPITNKLTQGRFVFLIKAICARSWSGLTAVAFYNNVQQIETLKKYVNNSKNGYIIATDIDKTEQEIKDIFNVTTKPIIIYYYEGREITRNNNFDINDTMSEDTLNYTFECGLSRFFELKNLIQEEYSESIADFSRALSTKILIENSIGQDLTLLHFLVFLETLQKHSRFGITAVAFYNNIQQIEFLKKYFENAKNGYIIAADIHTTEQEIKNAFNITAPTIIYYYDEKEVARTTDFDKPFELS